MGESHEDEKQRLRRRIEAMRTALPAAEVARLSAAAAARVLQLPAFTAARHVVVYAAMRSELDPSMIADRAGREGKRVYHPARRTDPPGFVAVDGSQDRLLPPADGVLVLVPGVAFDASGVRLGRGAGWYDRALAEHPHAIRVGVAFDFQLVPSVPEDAWDVRMHAVVTDARLVGEPAPAVAE